MSALFGWLSNEAMSLTNVAVGMDNQEAHIRDVKKQPHLLRDASGVGVVALAFLTGSRKGSFIRPDASVYAKQEIHSSPAKPKWVVVKGFLPPEMTVNEWCHAVGLQDIQTRACMLEMTIGGEHDLWKFNAPVEILNGVVGSATGSFESWFKSKGFSAARNYYTLKGRLMGTRFGQIFVEEYLRRVRREAVDRSVFEVLHELSSLPYSISCAVIPMLASGVFLMTSRPPLDSARGASLHYSHAPNQILFSTLAQGISAIDSEGEIFAMQNESVVQLKLNK